MDLDEPIELSRDRAASSEPASTRTKPFDSEQSSSRKRQRLETDDQENRSTTEPAAAAASPPNRAIQQPTTPTASRMAPILPTTPNSNRVTLNLRKIRESDPTPSAPNSPPSLDTASADTTANMEKNPGSEADTHDVHQTIETPSSSLSSEEPEVMLIEPDQDYDSDANPPVDIINDVVLEEEEDPTYSFPFKEHYEITLIDAAARLAVWFEQGNMSGPDQITRFRAWLEKYINWARRFKDDAFVSYCEHREFWEYMHEVIKGLTCRKPHFGNWLKTDSAARLELSKLFRALASLTGLFVEMDLRTVKRCKEYPEKTLVLAARPFLDAIWYLLQTNIEHVGMWLGQCYQWDWEEETMCMHRALESEGASLSTFIRLAEAYLDMLPRQPRLVDQLMEICRHVLQFLCLPGVDRTGQDYEHRIAVAYTFFEMMEKHLITFIEKNATFLNVELVLGQITALSEILKRVLAARHDPAEIRAQEVVQADPGFYTKYIPRAGAIRWKLSMLNRLITSSQMQLRVGGIASFCTELLALYAERNGISPPEHPVLRNIGKYVVSIHIVEYIVGTGTHPEIIAHSRDLLGFLAVTKTYTDYHADKIWSTVKSSQDHRVVESILRMLHGVFNLMTVHDRMYLCNKMQELPAESFQGAQMRFCCEELFRLVCQDSVHQSADLEAPPYEVCVRLICESTAPRADSPLAFNEVQHWASMQFDFLANHNKCAGPSTSVRQQIYDRCLNDLHEGRNADGGLLVLCILLQHNPYDLNHLIDREDFIPLLIENFSWRKTKTSIAKHLRLFRQLIVKNFIKDTANLGLQLWNKIIGAEEADIEEDERQNGWRMLSDIMKEARPENVFINACIQQYLPNLPPHLFSKVSFSFARQAIGYFSTEHALGSQDDSPVIDQNGVEQLWRMVLSSNDRATFQQYAFNELISFYLDSTMINRLSRDKVQEIHLAFVDRCLEQLKSAAAKLKSFSEGTTSGDDEPMVIVVPDKEIHNQESLFCKSLLLLKGFLRAHDSNPRFAPPKRSKPQRTNTTEEIKGKQEHVSYQIFTDGVGSEVKKLSVGSLNTGAYLFGSLQQLAGSKHIRVHYKGKEVTASDIDLSKPLDELDLGLKGHLLLVSTSADPNIWNEHSPVHLQIVKSFDDLVDLLAMDGTQAKDLYDLLFWFPPYGKLHTALTSETVSYQELFPAQHPYKSLYAMRCLRALLTTPADSDEDELKLKQRYFDLLIETLASHEYLRSHMDEDAKVYFSIELLDSLAYSFQDMALRERFESGLSSEALLPILMSIFDEAQKGSTIDSPCLMYRAFSIILAMSTSSTRFWQKFKAHPGASQIVQALLLGPVEKASIDDVTQAANRIGDLCCQELGLDTFIKGGNRLYADLFRCPSYVDQAEFLQFFWPLLMKLVPKATSNPKRCEQFLELVQQVFGAAIGISRTTDIFIDGLDLEVLSRQWGKMLIKHKVVQYVGRPADVDPVPIGLACLLKACILSMEPTDLSSLKNTTLAFQLFNTHLFPDLDEESAMTLHTQLSLPMLDSATRKIIVEIIEALVEDDDFAYAKLIKKTASLVPEPDIDGLYQYEVSHTWDRSREIRSATGYVGLKNLSNTCYLNSLMTQLFMNVSFRQFMMNANIVDPGAQNLLQQTKILFCEMQNSFKRYADPTELTQSIKTYEEAPIDVTVQMDVDEFYNLLFDRWEGQILANDSKAAFRSFYGGQLVQQVKSKECPHISERLEPFSAIQCDIKGRGSLEESLQAYVDGEIMEGDNKYKCSTCDQHVDAVKRACLKDVPDNLIFHLKRFDYDLRENRRNKLNDYFSFPNDIDMRPYKVDYLTNGPEGSEEDMFELVGVLVHSGTAESGHYYSYIRERPAKDNKSWVEYNDDQVSPFDPSNIEATCFGGANFHAGEYQFDKNFSAYMLFYQRRSYLLEQNQKLGHLLGVEPIKLPISPASAQPIDDENALLMRTYALFDPSHARFVKKLLSVPKCHRDMRPKEHLVKNQALEMTLNHLDQVFARARDIPEVEWCIKMLVSMCEECSLCAERLIGWISKSPTAFKYFLVKSPEQKVRSGVSGLIIAALQSLKKFAPIAYGFTRNDQQSVTPRFLGAPLSESVHELNEEHKSFGSMVMAICQLWDNVVVSFRAWPEFFDLVYRMMDGKNESALLMDNGLLLKTMEIIGAHFHTEPSHEITRMLNNLSRRNKAVAFDPVILLLDKFLAAFDSINVDEDRLSRSDQCSQDIPLTMWNQEYNAFNIYWTASEDGIFVGELLKRDTFHDEATQSIIKQLLLKVQGPRKDSILKCLFFAISENLRKVNRQAPFLRAALTFCRYTNVPEYFEHMVDQVQKCVLDGEALGDASFLEFFKALAELPETEVGYSERQLWRLCMKQLLRWGPALLVNYDADVRIATEEYITQAILQHCDATAMSDADDDKDHHKRYLEAARNLGVTCLDFLERNYVQTNMQVLRTHLYQIKAVCDKCRDLYEEGSPLQAQFLDLESIVWTTMRERLAVTQIDDEGSVGSDEWEQSDAELSSSSLLAEDRDVISLLDNTTDL